MDNIVTQSEIVSNVITNLIEDSVKNAWEKQGYSLKISKIQKLLDIKQHMKHI